MKHTRFIFLFLLFSGSLFAQNDTLSSWEPSAKLGKRDEFKPMDGFESVFRTVLMTDTLHVWQSIKGAVFSGSNQNYEFRMLMNKPGEPMHVFYECALLRSENTGLTILEAKWRTTETVRKKPRGEGNPVVAETVTEGVDYWLLGKYMKVSPTVRLISLPVSAKTTRWEEQPGGAEKELDPAYCAIKSKFDVEEGKLYILGTTCLGPQVNIFSPVLEGVYRMGFDALVRE